MAWKLEVGGVDKTQFIRVADEVTIDKPLNSRALASFTCVLGYQPARFSEVSLYADDGVTKDFGGVILQRRGVELERSDPFFTQVDCVDYSFYADVTFATLTYDLVTPVEDIVDDLIDLLVSFGITYTPTVTGLTLSGIAWSNVTVMEALRQISAATQLVFRFLPDKSVVAFVPGSIAAPVSMTDANPNCMEVNWQDSDQIPYNRVVLLCGPAGAAPAPRMEWVANGIATSWVTDLEAADPPPILVLVDDGVTPYLATVGVLPDAPVMFYWDRATHTLSLGTNPVPASGTKIVLGGSFAAGDPFESPGTFYTAQYPFTVVKTTGASPVLSALFADETILSKSQGEEIAQGLRDRLAQDPRKLSITSLVSGFEPGQELVMGLAAKAVGNYLIMSVSKVRDSDAITHYRIEATESAVYQDTFLDNWREKLSGGTSSAAVTVGGSPGIGNAPGPPTGAVQFNLDGDFGGDAEFTYDPDMDSIVCGGGGSSITAAEPDSCQVFGSNCHITD